MRLYSYFRSSAAYRVRIALALKGLPYDYQPVHLLKDGGQQMQPGFRRMSPDAVVPVLEDDGHALTQSLAIIEYLDETHPEPALLPATPAERARVRALALSIACDIHPLNNLRVLKYLKKLGIDQQGRDDWYRHWVGNGLAAFERMLADSPHTGRCCHGDQPTLADLCLVPQVYNARRLKVDLSAMPTVVQVADHCAALPAFEAAHPDKQPDAE
ncbi:MAG: maleylacetoacetate isomerase [Pigmentiphaga sp.]|uniref:maleylacetoacetate isomerase n=1 Tax=Pigmentiphaga sp. TaxID=1977564 RepID=UPI0029BEE30D|nr:maleylacetoacetate isomerase [Pigmentiphaga sp.]MDX3904155.1 maleylacetoacetate isomerase [Pigmentiphaga sp.]